MKKTVLWVFLLGCQALFAKENGWQFHSFFGDYEVVSRAECSLLSGTVKVGFFYSKESPQMEIQSRFETDGSKFYYLRDLELHGDDCYECDEAWWDSSKVGGDGVRNATFKNSGIEPYNHKPYSTTIELVRLSSDRVAMKWDSCRAELLKK